MVGRLSAGLGTEGLKQPVISAAVERFAAMGTRVELHVFGAGSDALFAARRAIEAVDDALTIHRPSPTGALNDELLAGGSATVRDPILIEALGQVDAAYAATGGLFDPAVEHGGWKNVRFDRDCGQVSATQPVALDWGGFGKGFALDRASAILKDAGVTSALLSAGESSIAVIGEHPLGGCWPFAIPHPLELGGNLIEIEMIDEALSISSTIGSSQRSAMLRRGRDTPIETPCTTLAIERSGAWAEAMSTALLVADEHEAAPLLRAGRRHRFNFEDADRSAIQPIRVFA